MGVPVKVWLGGEGPNELGGRGHNPPTARPGVIETLLRRIEAAGWRVVGATVWNRIPKYRAGIRSGEERSVLGLIQEAWEERAEVVAFTRDTDREVGRKKRIEDAIETAKAHFAGPAYRDQPIGIVGGAACPAIEGWILALAGERDTDDMSKLRTFEKLHERQIDRKKTDAYLAVIDAADITAALPPGCKSLEIWLDRARAVLRVAIHGVAKNNV